MTTEEETRRRSREARFAASPKTGGSSSGAKPLSTSRVSRLLLALYAAFLLAVVAAANLGGTNEVFELVGAIPFGDKLGHFGLIGLLALAADAAAKRHDLRLGRLAIPTAPLVVLVLVAAEELSQIAMVTRTFDLLDFAADVAGIVAFVSVGRWVAAKFVACDDVEARPSPRRS